MNIIESNKLIAEFMGGENTYHKGHYICHNGIATLPEDMRFHFSWEWLMPVVDKINGLNNVMEIRENHDFPEIFKQMAEAEREVNATCLKDKNGRIYLDELDPKAGNPTDLVTGGCGIFCQVEFAYIMSKRTNDILEGKVSIYAWS